MAGATIGGLALAAIPASAQSQDAQTIKTAELASAPVSASIIKATDSLERQINEILRETPSNTDGTVELAKNYYAPVEGEIRRDSLERIYKVVYHSSACPEKVTVRVNNNKSEVACSF